MHDDEVVRLRRAVLRMARQLNTSATDGGLTPSQASVLGLVCGRGPISLPDLVRLEHINPTMLSRVVGKLDDAGLVVRARDPEDKRSATLTATADGRAVFERVRSAGAATVSRAARRLPAADRTALAHALPALEHLAEELASD